VRLASLCLVPVALAALASEAGAYQCTFVSESNVSQAWLNRCIPYAISCRNDLLLDDKSQAIVARSFAAWENVDCSDINFTRVGYSPEYEYFDVNDPDGQYNTIALVDQDEDKVFPDPRLLALTFTHFAVATGEILDADILFNAARFEFVDVDELSSCDENDNVFDLENTLVHEIGHLVGFDHVDLEAATMFARASGCETVKRTLDQDDINGLCRVYPNGGQLDPCFPPPNGYDNGALDAEDYRNQCARFADGTIPTLDLMQCQAALAGGGVCSCRSTQSETGHGTTAWFAIVGVLILRKRRRAAHAVR